MEDFSSQVEAGLKLKLPKINTKKFNNIVFLGMGGSAVVGDIFADYYDAKPVIVIKNYDIPKWVNKKSLVFVISYSGNTEETISMYKQAKKRGCKTIIITSNGFLGKTKEAIIVKGGMQPRDALPSMLLPVLRILCLNKEIKSIIGLENKIDNALIKELAEKLSNGNIVVYGSNQKLCGLTKIWKMYLNENSKMLVHTGFFSEANHNELEANELDKYNFVLLKDKEVPRLEKQIDFVDKFFNFKEVELKGINKLEKLFYGALLGSYVSREIASIKGIEFKKIDKIEMLKKALQE